MVYTRDEAIEQLKNEGFDNLQSKVIADKYLLKDKEDPRIFLEATYLDVCERLSVNIWPNHDENRDLLFDLMYNERAYIFGGSIMSGLGSERYQSLSNCFVIASPKDDYGRIIETELEQVSLMKRRGGVGHDLSNIRPKGSTVENSALTSTGIVPFMKRYSNATEEVAQDGRRGALMLSISVYHPDIMDFINAKREHDEINQANISVRVDKNFIDKAMNREDYYLKFPVHSDNKVKTLNAGEVLDKIAESIRLHAEPGILFWDKITDMEYDIACTNPCGEVPMPAYDSCILGHINLISYIENPYESNSYFNFSKFKDDVSFYTKSLDRVVDLEIKYIDRILTKLNSNHDASDIEVELWEKIKKQKKKYRRIGQGITGLGDALAALRLDYDSKEALKVVYKIMELKNRTELKTSELLYTHYKNPDYANDKYSEYYSKKYNIPLHGVNNIALSTIAPVGSGSIILGSTSGMEPLFSKKLYRKVKTSNEEEIIEVNHKPFYPVELPEDYLNYYVEANDVNVESKIEMQSILQEFTHLGISVTHNLPNSVNSKDIKDLILLSYVSNNKGFTCYVEGSRDGVLTREKKKENRIDENKRPRELKGKVFLFKSNGDEYNIIVGIKDERPYELFTLKKKMFLLEEQDCTIIKEDKKYNIKTDNILIRDVSKLYDQSSTELITRHISRRLRYENLEEVIKDFDRSVVEFGTVEQAIYRALLAFKNDNTETPCPECGEKLNIIEGCLKCPSCGYSKC